MSPHEPFLKKGLMVFYTLKNQAIPTRGLQKKKRKLSKPGSPIILEGSYREPLGVRAHRGFTIFHENDRFCLKEWTVAVEGLMNPDSGYK